MSTVGFIGLGTMGRHMANNLLAAGHRLVIYARRPEVVESLAEGDRVAADSPAEVASQSEFVITIVTADADVREVVLGPSGVIESAAPGKTLIEMSTISPATVRDIGERLKQRGMAMLDAPVSGGPWGAEQGTLSIMAGGEGPDFEKCQPLFDALGKNIFHLGPLGAGQTVKLVNQLIGGGIMTLIAEGLVLAKSAGLDLDKVADVVSVSSGNSTLFEARVKKFILANQYAPGFKTELMRKDMGLALDMGRQQQVPLPMAAAAYQLYTAAINGGFGADDFASVARVCAQAAGVELDESTPNASDR